jgi:hypothetical protein
MTAPGRSSLPLRDYDHLPPPALANRIRSLTAEEISQLLSYEREHANRLPVVQLLQTRLAELAAGPSRPATASRRDRNGPRHRPAAPRSAQPRPHHHRVGRRTASRPSRGRPKGNQNTP